MHTVTFNANGGLGTVPAPQSAAPGSSIFLPAPGGLTRSGFAFGGWNSNAAGTGTNRNAGAGFRPTGDVTMYARWLPGITWNATAAGSPTTTTINLTFGAIIEGLSVTDITITSGTGSATRGALTGIGTTRTLHVSNVTAGTVSISINHAGIASGPQTVTLVAPAAGIAWNATPVGSPTTTAIYFAFNANPGMLIASDFTIVSGTGSATVGTLTGTGNTRTLTVYNVTAGTVSVYITWGNANRAPRTVTLAAQAAGIAWSATPVGSPTTTAIDFNFTANPIGLLASDITITSGTGSATTGTLTGSGNTRTLTISNVSAGTVSIFINWTGIASGPQTVTLVAPAR